MKCIVVIGRKMTYVRYYKCDYCDEVIDDLYIAIDITHYEDDKRNTDYLHFCTDDHVIRYFREKYK
jgi:hypothetical protein